MENSWRSPVAGACASITRMKRMLQTSARGRAFKAIHSRIWAESRPGQCVRSLERGTPLRRVLSLVLLRLVFDAIRRPRNSFQAGRLNLTSTCDALAVRAVLNAFQGIPH